MGKEEVMVAEEQQFSKLTIIITTGLQEQFERVRELESLVKEKEYEAQKDGFEIDYSNFPEYSELHILKSSVRERLADAAWAFMKAKSG